MEVTENQRQLALFTERWRPREAEMRRLYFEDKLSQMTIAQHFGVNLSTIQKAMRRLSIPSRSRGRSGAEHHQYQDGTASRLYRKGIVKERCERCNRTTNLAIHHRNLDHYDDQPENLMVVCVSCHSSIHKQAYWDAKKAGTPYQTNAPIGWRR